MNKILVTYVIAVALVCGAASAQTTTVNENKRVTRISAQSTADGKSQITERPLEECIVSLPSASELAPDVKAGSEYLKEIGGDPAKNGHTKVYSAAVTVSYKVRQKFLLIVTTSSIEGKDPVIQEQERTTMLSKTFASDPGEGDIFAGRSNRKYYYSTPEAAANNARARAEAWIAQQQNVLCSVGAEKK